MTDADSVIQTGVSVSARALIAYLRAERVLGDEHEARCQAVLGLASQIDAAAARAVSDPLAAPTAALWQAYDRLLRPLEELAPRRDPGDPGMPGLEAGD